MGWNSWNCWASAVSDAKVRAAADAMVHSGLAAHGFQYVNIDDCWEGDRDAHGEIQTNEKFPDMKALADYVHGKGLKLGIYSSPGPKTCAGFEASWKHEAAGRRHLCQVGHRLPQVRLVLLRRDRPAIPDLAGLDEALPGDAQRPWTAAAATSSSASASTAWATSGSGARRSAATAGGPPATSPTTGAACPASASARPATSATPAPATGTTRTCWWWARSAGGPTLHPTQLTPNEQVTHITLWSLLAAPLLIGCDMSQMDDFTLALLTNDEVLDVNQDPLGKQAGADRAGRRQRGLGPAAGRRHAGRGPVQPRHPPAKVKVAWADLKLSGPQPVRDLWRQKDLGRFADGYEATVPSHGAVLLKVGQPKEEGPVKE